MEEIESNGYNLNITRYISIAEPEEDIELYAVHERLATIEADIEAAKHQHNEYLRELGLPELR